MLRVTSMFLCVAVTKCPNRLMGEGEVMLTDSWEVLGHCSIEHITELVVMGRHCGRLGSREQKLIQGLGYNL